MRNASLSPEIWIQSDASRRSDRFEIREGFCRGPRAREVRSGSVSKATRRKRERGWTPLGSLRGMREAHVLRKASQERSSLRRCSMKDSHLRFGIPFVSLIDRNATSLSNRSFHPIGSETAFLDVFARFEPKTNPFPPSGRKGERSLSERRSRPIRSREVRSDGMEPWSRTRRRERNTLAHVSFHLTSSGSRTSSSWRKRPS